MLVTRVSLLVACGECAEHDRVFEGAVAQIQARAGRL